MLARPSVLPGALIATALLVAGCGSSAPSDPAAPATEADAPVATAGPAAYVESVSRLLAPPSEMARLAAAQGRAGAPPAPTRAELQGLVERAEAERARLAALRPGAPGLERQRARLLSAYDDVVVTMRAAVDPVSEGRRVESRRVAFRLLAELQELPSAVA